MSDKQVTQEEIDSLYKKLNEDAESGGYHLNPDIGMTKDLIEGLIINTKRYGYESCPCRLSAGSKEKDLDIICPCDYRDQDINEYDACYCGLYVSGDVFSGKKEARPIPERRPMERPEQPLSGDIASSLKHTDETGKGFAALPYPVWRCKVCGYLCARNDPPGVCPVCKAKKERFERFF